MTVSRRTRILALLGALSLLPACASTTVDGEMRKLEARASYEAGVKSIAEGKVSLGLASLRQAVEIEPGNPIYHNAVGAVMLSIGRFPDAEVEFLKAVELDPTYADAFHNLGSTHAEQGKWAEAIVAYRKALAQTIYARPETTYNNLGYAYWALDRRKEAEDAFRAALQLEPKLVPSHFWLGVLLEKEGRKAEARNHFRAARDLEPASLLGRQAAEVLKAMGEGG
ncbi:MAG TPA: tetratricopeptide repeat protein [Methylomirabilota bacterium]|nr:tetratricopeptide repeat protein [Methylomirabilota bacterium]